MALSVQKTDTAVVSDEQLALVVKRARLLKRREKLNEQIAEVEAEIVESLPDGVSRVRTAGGKPVVTYLPTASRGRFDREAFKAAHPRIHDRFWTPGIPGAGGNRLTITY